MMMPVEEVPVDRTAQTGALERDAGMTSALSRSPEVLIVPAYPSQTVVRQSTSCGPIPTVKTGSEIEKKSFNNLFISLNLSIAKDVSLYSKSQNILLELEFKM
jgi:hypothetical protein